MSKILFYFSDHGANHERVVQNTYGGVGYYRIIKPSQQVKGHEVTVMGSELTKKGETAEERWERLFDEYDVFWCPYFSDPMEASALFSTRDWMGKKVVIDCDDNFLDVLESHPLYDKLKTGKRDKAFMATILSLADVVTVSTEPLKQRLRKHFKEVQGIEKNIVVIPNMNDIKDWDVKREKRDPKKIVIGYPGSNSHQDDLAMLMPSLLEVMKKHKHVYFEVVGSISKDMLPMFDTFPLDVMKRIDIWPGTFTFKEYPAFIGGRNWDIGVCPLADNVFTRCKSHIKFMEYSALKIPVIASRVHPYYVPIEDKFVIEHEKTGLLVKPNEWVEALERMITDAELRKTLATNAHQHILDNWQYNLSEKINEVLAL